MLKLKDLEFNNDSYSIFCSNVYTHTYIPNSMASKWVEEDVSNSIGYMYACFNEAENEPELSFGCYTNSPYFVAFQNFANSVNMDVAISYSKYTIFALTEWAKEQSILSLVFNIGVRSWTESFEPYLTPECVELIRKELDNLALC